MSVLDKVSKCVVCGKEFVEGDWLQAFLRSKDKPEGDWSDAIEVDARFQERIVFNGDKIKRRHARHCFTKDSAE